MTKNQKTQAEAGDKTKKGKIRNLLQRLSRDKPIDSTDKKTDDDKESYEEDIKSLSAKESDNDYVQSVQKGPVTVGDSEDRTTFSAEVPDCSACHPLPDAIDSDLLVWYPNREVAASTRRTSFSGESDNQEEGSDDDTASSK